MLAKVRSTLPLKVAPESRRAIPLTVALFRMTSPSKVEPRISRLLPMLAKVRSTLPLKVAPESRRAIPLTVALFRITSPSKVEPRNCRLLPMLAEVRSTFPLKVAPESRRAPPLTVALFRMTSPSKVEPVRVMDSRIWASLRSTPAATKDFSNDNPPSTLRFRHLTSTKILEFSSQNRCCKRACSRFNGASSMRAPRIRRPP